MIVLGAMKRILSRTDLFLEQGDHNTIQMTYILQMVSFPQL